MEELRVLVVSGDPLARAGLALLLGGQEGITVFGQVAPDEDWPGPDDPGAVLWDRAHATASAKGSQLQS